MPRMLESGPREPVRSDLGEAEAPEQCARRVVLRMMSGEERGYVEHIECVSDHGPCCFGCVAGTPERGQELKTDLAEVRPRLSLVRPETAAAGERVLDEYGPVLDP